MRLFLNPHSAALAAALLATSFASLPAAAVPFASRSALAPIAGDAGIVHVHYKRGDVRYHRAKRHRHHDHVVDAPFTRVRSGRRVEVDAPFTAVTVTRHGRHVRAPFVDLWVPRGR